MSAAASTLLVTIVFKPLEIVQYNSVLGKAQMGR